MSEHKWTEEHGPDKLYSKFDVYKPKDRVDDDRHFNAYAKGDIIGSDGEFIFVLRPERDEAACQAITAYSYYVQARSPELANQLREKMKEIGDKQCQNPG